MRRSSSRRAWRIPTFIYDSLDLDNITAAVPSLGTPPGELAARVGEIRIESGDDGRLVLPFIDGKAASAVVVNPRVISVTLRDVPVALCPSLVGVRVGSMPPSDTIDGVALARQRSRRTRSPHTVSTAGRPTA